MSGKNVQRLRHTSPVNAAARHLPRLFTEIERYLAFSDLAREDDSFWREYCAWKKLSDADTLTLAQKMKLYSMKR